MLSQRPIFLDKPDRNLALTDERDVLFASVEGIECTHPEYRPIGGMIALLLFVVLVGYFVVHFFGASYAFAILALFLAWKIYYSSGV